MREKPEANAYIDIHELDEEDIRLLTYNGATEFETCNIAIVLKSGLRIVLLGKSAQEFSRIQDAKSRKRQRAVADNVADLSKID